MNHFWARWTKMESDHVLQSGWVNWLLNIMFTGGRCFLGLSTVITHETSVIPFAFYPVIALERYSIFSHESIFFTYGFAPMSLGVCLTCSYLGSMPVCVVIRGTIGTLDYLITIFVRLYHIYVSVCVCEISVGGITNDPIIQRYLKPIYCWRCQWVHRNQFCWHCVKIWG